MSAEATYKVVLLRHGESTWNKVRSLPPSDRGIRARRPCTPATAPDPPVGFDAQENRFTGWTDVPLSETGHEEAVSAGKLLKKEGFVFDVAYTSVLKRAIATLWHVLEELDLMWIPVHRDYRLNERHYGALQVRIAGHASRPARAVRAT